MWLGFFLHRVLLDWEALAHRRGDAATAVRWRAEAVRLSALCEAEVERGTRDLDDLDRQISMSQSQIEAALDALSQSAGPNMPEVIVQADCDPRLAWRCWHHCSTFSLAEIVFVLHVFSTY